MVERNSFTFAPRLCLLLAFFSSPGPIDQVLNCYPVGPAPPSVPQPCANCGAKAWLESGEEIILKVQERQEGWSKAGWGSEMPSVTKRSRREIMRMFDESRSYVEEKRKGDNVMESFCARQRGGYKHQGLLLTQTPIWSLPLQMSLPAGKSRF